MEHLLRLGSLDRQLGEGAVDLVAGAQDSKLLVDDRGVDGLGECDEAHLPLDLDEWQTPP